MPTEPGLALLRLLQLCNSSLPVGAFSYSEGLESLVDQGRVNDARSLDAWLRDALGWGPIRLEAGGMLRAYRAAHVGDRRALRGWNAWLTATKETEELRLQSLQMGQSLAALLRALDPAFANRLAEDETWNYAIGFGVAAAAWGIPPRESLLGYLHGWASNLLGAGIRLIPLGQTAAQELLHALQRALVEAAEAIADMPDDDLFACSWGQSLASMQHEAQYSRLFRS